MPVLVGEGEEHLEDEELQREQRCKFIARAWFGHQNESSVELILVSARYRRFVMKTASRPDGPIA